MNHLKTALKFAFAFILVGWLVKSGKIDFSLLKQSLQYPGTCLLSLMLLVGNVLIGTYRWKTLVETKSQNSLKFLQVLRVQWIGIFFNTILPGAVTGDMVKLLYAKDLDKDLDKTFLLTSVLMDRLLGLIGFVCILGISSAIYYNELVALSSEVSILLRFNFFLLLGVMVFLVGIFLPNSIQDPLLAFFQKIPLLGHQVAKTLAQLWILGKNKRIIFFVIVVSMIAQTLNIMALWNLASQFFNHPVPLKYAFSFVPIGFISVAIPITPAGIGVGHVVFDKLFSFFNVQNGASLFNLYFLVATVIYLCGLIPYLFSGRRHSLKEAQALEL